jgi:hypothetical protein
MHIFSCDARGTASLDGFRPGDMGAAWEKVVASAMPAFAASSKGTISGAT